MAAIKIRIYVRKKERMILKDTFITGDMLVRYYELNKQKKEIELEMDTLKDAFHK
jgi:hypothetical protein